MNTKSHKTKINDKCIVMDIDVNCSVQIAMQRFAQKGFEIVDNDQYILKGQFLNRTATVQLTPSKQNKFIGWVAVYLGYDNNKSYPSWEILKNDLIQISEEIQRIYGVKYVSSYEFKSPYKEGDGNEFSAICSEKANIFTALYPNKDGVFLIKTYPTSISIDKMLIIVHFYNESAGLGNLN